MFKSTTQTGISKKGMISFNKMAASPRQPNSRYAIPDPPRNTQDQFARPTGSILTLEVSSEKLVSSHKCMFPYNGNTTIG